MAAARLSCEPWSEHLRIHLPVSADGEDSEGVHQVRVAAARLRVWLRLGGLTVLEDDLRWLRDAASEVRDLDVLIGMGGATEYVEGLHRRWADARRGWLQALRSGRTQGLLQALYNLPPIEARRARRTTRRWQARTCQAGDALDWRDASEEELHAFRRGVRRLRYAREWIGPPDARIKELSEELGELNDLFVLRALLAGGNLPPAAAPDPNEVGERIAEQREQFAARWKGYAKALRRGAG